MKASHWARKKFMSQTRHKRGIFKPFHLPVAPNAKPIMAEYRHGVLRPRGGTYFQPYLAKFRHSHLSGSRAKAKRQMRRISRQRQNTELVKSESDVL